MQQESCYFILVGPVVVLIGKQTLLLIKYFLSDRKFMREDTFYVLCCNTVNNFSKRLYGHLENYSFCNCSLVTLYDMFY